MTTSLDKQAREFWLATDHKVFPYLADDVINFAAAFATQVREQTVKQCAKTARWMPCDAVPDGQSLIDHCSAAKVKIENEILKLAAPPQTTEQERG